VGHCCADGERTFQAVRTDIDCDGIAPICGGPEDGWVAWEYANRPQNRPETCENPWSDMYVDCDAGPEPKSPREPVNSCSNTAGDPVDLTTGTLEQSATDVDLGRGLAFTRHYASNRPGTTPIGKGWKHELDWRLRYQLTTQTPVAEVVVVDRPLATPTAFFRATTLDPWKGGARGAGGLSGDEPDGFTFTDDDGTTVRFDRVASQTFHVGQIQPPGQPTITVTYNGATTTFSQGGSSVAIATYTSGTNAGQIQTVSGGGQTWAYTYDSSNRLLSATRAGCLDAGQPGRPDRLDVHVHERPLEQGGADRGRRDADARHVDLFRKPRRNN
jgi:YD repeat-containing protein